MAHPHENVRSLVPLLALLVGLATGACASVPLEARPDLIPDLESAAARDADDTGVATRLGVAYFAADRFEDARRILQTVVDAGADEGAAFLYLGLASEELEDWAAARAAYDAYLLTGTSAAVKRDIRARLRLVNRKELREYARAALAQERILSDQPPTPNTVAVLPFRVGGLPEELQPLRTALADMIITDLGFTPLRSVERVRVQAMIDEMALAQAGLTAENSGARMGRMLKAAHVVEGVLSGGESELVLDASLLDTDRQATRDELNQRGRLDAIFDLEKSIVFEILDALGVELTAREREAITNNRAANLVAFIAYGRGLEALDRGDYGEALSQFREAARLDPGFQAARAQQVEASELTGAAGTTRDRVAEAGLGEVTAPAKGRMAASIANEVNYSPAAAMKSESAAPGNGKGPAAASGRGSPDKAGPRRGPPTNPQERRPGTERRPEPPLSQATTGRIIIIITNPGGSL